MHKNVEHTYKKKLLRQMFTGGVGVCVCVFQAISGNHFNSRIADRFGRC